MDSQRKQSNFEQKNNKKLVYCSKFDYFDVTNIPKERASLCERTREALLRFSKAKTKRRLL